MDYPGGCSIGSRPVDFHLRLLRQLGAEIQEREKGMEARAERLAGAMLSLSYPSVGATENAVMAAVLADGVTVLRGAAREPEVQELCRMLNGMGADISGIGTGCLKIRGVKELHDSCFSVPGDRIAAGTYLSCVMAAGGNAVLRGVRPGQLTRFLEMADEMGAVLWPEEDAGTIRIAMEGRPHAVSAETGPYPAFPTDLQSPVLTLLAVSEGTGSIREKVFEGRFATVSQLKKLGAEITVDGDTARVQGRYPLQGTEVEAPDLRGGAALVAAGLAAQGETVIGGCSHILRGYEDICGDLRKLGAEIWME